MKKPNLFIVGAPKCGTTSLSKWLSNHPEAFLPKIKEPYFFADDLNIGQVKGEKDYNSLFKNIKNIQKIVLDASSGYLYSTNAISNILKYCDEKPKFVIMLRNPVQMVYSLHSQIHYMGWEEVADFESAWFMQEKRKRGELLPKNCPEKKVLLYKEWCKLGHQLREFMGKAEGCECYIMWLDDLREDSKKEYLKLLDFLGLDKSFLPSFNVHNQNKTHRSKNVQIILSKFYKYKHRLGIKKEFGLNRFNSIERRRLEMSGKMRRLLVNEFKDDILLLQEITGRDLKEWLE